MKDATGVDTSILPAKRNFCDMKAEVDKLGIKNCLISQIVWIV